MKILKDWKSFNEMNRSTYINAAKKFRELGHEEKAKRLEKHPTFLDNLEKDKRVKKNLKKYADIEPFSFKIKNLKFEGRFTGLDLGCTHDMWEDNDHNITTIPCYFYMIEKNTNDSYEFSPFWLEFENLDQSEGRISLTGAFMTDESPWRDEIPEGDYPVLFDNRRDANRFINLLKSGLIKNDIEEIYQKHKIPNKKQFLKACDEVISKLNPKILFR